MTLQALQSLRSEENFSLFWQKACRKAKELGVSDPVLPRRRKTPKRYETGESDSEFPKDVESMYRRIYYEALDLITVAIETWFQQSGYKVYCKLEDVLLKAANKKNYEDSLEFVCNFYKEDVNRDQLKLQLDVMASNLPEDAAPWDLHSLLEYFKDLSDAQRVLLSEVCVLVQLIMVMPATNAVSERSFNFLRRIKTYLRSTMTQMRLNNVMTLHVHKELTDKLDLTEIGNEFVSGSEHRLTVFGKFLPSDVGP